MDTKIINLGNFTIPEGSAGSFSFKMPSDESLNPVSIYNIAQGFYLAGKRSSTNVTLADGHTEYLLTPTVVSFCFSCELFMKSIYLKNNGTKISGHNLKKLFDELPEDVRERIYKSVSLSIHNMSLPDLINEISEHFVKARYDFEYSIELYREFEIEVLASSLYQETASMLGKEIYPSTYTITKI